MSPCFRRRDTELLNYQVIITLNSAGVPYSAGEYSGHLPAREEASIVTDVLVTPALITPAGTTG